MSVSEESWYVLEGLKATVRLDHDVDNENIESDVENNTELNAISQPSKPDTEHWYTVNDDANDEGTVHTQSLSSEASCLDDVEQTNLDASNDQQPTSIHRFNLQESIDGEISESIHSSSAHSSNTSKFSANSRLSENTDDTTSLLANAQLENNVLHQNVNTMNDGKTLQWHNLTTNSNMQDISRPDPVGFAHSDKEGMSLITPSLTQSQSSDCESNKELSKCVASQAASTSSSMNKDAASFSKKKSTASSASSSQSISNYSTSNRSASSCVTTGNNSVKIDDSQRKSDSDYVPDLSYTPSLIATENNDGLKQPVLPAQVLMTEQDENMLSIGSSLTLPSYKEISPEAHENTATDTPVTKLLGPAYKKTQRFLHGLKAAKIIHASSGNTTENLDTSASTLKSSKNESTQAGKSQLEYSLLTPEISDESIVGSTHSVKKQVPSQDDLVEQDLASASTIQLVKEDLNNVSTSNIHLQDHDSQSEGEMLLTDISDPLVNSGKRSVSSKGSHDQLTSLSNTTSSSRTNLEPIQEVLSPEFKQLEQTPLNHKNYVDSHHGIDTKLNDTNVPESSHTSYKSFKSGQVSSSSTPYGAELEHESSKTRGIYDVRKSTGPGSTNRKRIHAGKNLLNKKSSHSIDPFTVYVSEDSNKLLDSMASTQSINKNNESNALRETSKPNVNLSQETMSKLVYSADSRIIEISQKISNVESKSSRTMTSTTTNGSSTLPMSADHPSTDDTDVLITSNNTFLPQSSLLDQSKSDMELSDVSINQKKKPSVTRVSDQSRSDLSEVSIDATHVSHQEKKPTKSDMELAVMGLSETSIDTTHGFHQKKIISTHSVSSQTSIYNKSSHLINKSEVKRSASKCSTTGRVALENSTSFNAEKKLNLLWNEFDGTSREHSDSSSPIMRKLQLLSEIIREQKNKRRSHMNTSQSSNGTLHSNESENIDGDSSKPPVAKATSSRRKSWQESIHATKPVISPLHFDTSSSLDNLLDTNNVPSTAKTTSVNGKVKTYRVSTKRQESSPENFQTYRIVDARALNQPTSSAKNIGASRSPVGRSSHTNIFVEENESHSEQESPVKQKSSEHIDFQLLRERNSNNSKTKLNRHTNDDNNKTKIKKEKEKLKKTKMKTNVDEKDSYICPFCNKRSIGTNCPTPCSSDSRSTTPTLQLQTWTQTGLNQTKVDKLLDEEQLVQQQHVSAWVDLQNNSREEDHNQNITETKELVENFLPQHQTIAPPARKASRKKNLEARSKPEVAHIAWIHTIRSDKSDILPLSREVPLQERYMEHIQQKNKNKEINSSVGILTLQEAFLQHKQTFIHRLKQRVQDVKDTRLNEKHFMKQIRRRKNKATKVPKKDLKVAQPRLKLKKKERKLKYIVDKESPRELHRQEEEKLAMLRSNRLKMKQYDSRIRQRFLRRQPKRERVQCYVERH